MGASALEIRGIIGISASFFFKLLVQIHKPVWFLQTYLLYFSYKLIFTNTCNVKIFSKKVVFLIFDINELFYLVEYSPFTFPKDTDKKSYFRYRRKFRCLIMNAITTIKLEKYILVIFEEFLRTFYKMHGTNRLCQHEILFLRIS